MKRILFVLIHLLFFGGIVALGYFSLEYAKESGFVFDKKLFVFLCIYCGVCFLNSVIIYFHNIVDETSTAPLVLYAILFLTMIVVAVWSRFLLSDYLTSVAINENLRIGFVIRFLSYSLPVFVGFNIYYTFVFNWDGAHIEYEKHEFLAYIPLFIFIILNVSMYFVHQYVPIKAYNYTFWISFAAFALTYFIVFFACENSITTMIFTYSDYKNKRGAFKDRDDSPSEIARKAERDYQISKAAFEARVLDPTYSYLKYKYFPDNLSVYLSDSVIYIRATFKKSYDSKSDYESSSSRLIESFEDDAYHCAQNKLESGDNVSDISVHAEVEGEYWD